MAEQIPGTSQFGFAEAIYDALHQAYGEKLEEGSEWHVAQSWVTVGEHHSPWHITYNVVVQQGRPSG